MFCQWNCGWQPSAVITTILPYLYFLHRDIQPEHILISPPLQPVRKLGVEAKALQHILGVVQGRFFWWSVRAGSSATMMSWAFGRLGICHVLPRCSFEPFPPWQNVQSLQHLKPLKPTFAASPTADYLRKNWMIGWVPSHLLRSGGWTGQLFNGENATASGNISLGLGTHAGS